MSHISNLKSIKVACAIIEHEGKVLCAQRSEHMKHPLQWEFPGGKLEENEQLAECLHREILEELKVEIEILEKLPSNSHSYTEGKMIELIPFRCRLLTSRIILKEHLQVKWLPPDQLNTLDWVAADVPVVQHYLSAYS